MGEDYELPPGTPDPLTPSDVAKIFGVGVKTVTRWPNLRQIDYFRTPGGHRRYPLADVQAALRESYSPRRGDG